MDLSQTPPATVNDEPWLVPHRRRDGTIVECDVGFDDDVLAESLAMNMCHRQLKTPDGMVLVQLACDGCLTCHQAWPDLGTVAVSAASNAVHEEAQGSATVKCRVAIDSVRTWVARARPGSVAHDVVSLPGHDLQRPGRDVLLDAVHAKSRLLNAPAGHTLKCFSAIKSGV